MFAALLWLLALSPSEAIHVVTKDQEERQTLRSIAWRESRIRRVGIHKVDHTPRGWTGPGLTVARSVGSSAWVKAVQHGLLTPSWCPWHDRGSPEQWSTRGSWGLVAAYSVPYLPWCWPPWVLDVPAVSAWVAVRRLRRARRRHAPRALRRWAGA